MENLAKGAINSNNTHETKTSKIIYKRFFKVLVSIVFFFKAHAYKLQFSFCQQNWSLDWTFSRGHCVKSKYGVFLGPYFLNATACTFLVFSFFI